MAAATEVDKILPCTRGRVIGVSAGTGPTDKAAYVARPTGTHKWGVGAFLLAACAYHDNGPDR